VGSENNLIKAGRKQEENYVIGGLKNHFFLYILTIFVKIRIISSCIF